MAVEMRLIGGPCDGRRGELREAQRRLEFIELQNNQLAETWEPQPPLSLPKTRYHSYLLKKVIAVYEFSSSTDWG